MSRHAIDTGDGQFLRGFTWSVGGKKGSNLSLSFGTSREALRYANKADANLIIFVLSRLTDHAAEWKAVPA